MNETISMSRRELSRAEVMQQLKAKRITQVLAAEQLGLTVRHIKRLWRAYQAGGAQALVSKRRGRPSNHQLNPDVKSQALKLIDSTYPDFGPTLAHEKLAEVHHLKLGRETVRQLMVTAGHWQPDPAKAGRAHPMRPRRPRRGELVQIDGSPHAWFEDRGPTCTLLAYIDDATGQVQELFFTPAETTFSYFAATRRYLTQHGKPLAFYSDKHGIFRINAEAAVTGSGLTQFGRATDYNRRFAVVPTEPGDAHRPLLPGEALDEIFTLQTPRIVSKNLTFQYEKIVYQLDAPKGSYAFRGAHVVVGEDAEGAITVSYQGRRLAYSIFEPQIRQAEVVSSKQIDQAIAAAQAKRAPFIPAANHPWRNSGPLSRNR